MSVRLIKTPKYALLCGKCGDMRSFKAERWTRCACGNMAARFRSTSQLEVDVIAIHKHLAKIIEPKVLLRKHWAMIRKVGEGNTAWAPVIQRRIDEQGMLIWIDDRGILVSDFARARKRKKPRNRRKDVRESAKIIHLAAA